MVELASIVEKARSKNAGPFWLTIDIFCGSEQAFNRVRDGLTTWAVANRLGQDEAVFERFDMADLNVVKFSLPRPQIQGSRDDRDMHGASWAVLISAMEIE